MRLNQLISTLKHNHTGAKGLPLKMLDKHLPRACWRNARPLCLKSFFSPLGALSRKTLSLMASAEKFQLSVATDVNLHLGKNQTLMAVSDTPRELLIYSVY